MSHVKHRRGEQRLGENLGRVGACESAREQECNGVDHSMLVLGGLGTLFQREGPPWFSLEPPALPCVEEIHLYTTHSTHRDKSKVPPRGAEAATEPETNVTNQLRKLLRNLVETVCGSGPQTLPVTL